MDREPGVSRLRLLPLCMVFHASGALVGASLDKMKRDYIAQRDKEFAEHVCKTENSQSQGAK